MRQDPTINKVTPWEAQVLADIFRIMVKEIMTDEDKEKLAPGELGISYKEGTLYIRNPHTGKLFSPNSIEHIKQILTHYTPGTNILNADRIAGIQWYSSLSDLEDVGLYTWTPDTVIRQMEHPAVLFAPVECENHESYGWPSDSGTVVIYKVNEQFVSARYQDSITHIVYDGKYNKYKHLFEGWAVSGSNGDGIYVETEGGGDNTNIHTDRTLEDLMLLIVRVTETLNPGATITYNDGAPIPIYNQDGTPLGVEIAPNNIIMLLYDKLNQRWILADSTESSMKLMFSVTNQRIEDLRKEINLTLGEHEKLLEVHTELLEEHEKVLVDHEDRIADLENEVADLKKQLNEVQSSPGIIDSLVSNVTAANDGITEITEIQGFIGGVDKLIVNYEQTILRIGIDYTIVGNGIQLINDIALYKGDTVQFIILKQQQTS